MENPPQPERNMEAMIRKKTFFRKDPFPPLLSSRNSYYPKSKNLSTNKKIFTAEHAENAESIHSKDNIQKGQMFPCICTLVLLCVLCALCG
jgi:hypothetical protein